MQALKYSLSKNSEVTLAVDLARKTDTLELSSAQYNLVRTPGRPWPMGEPDKFYRIADAGRAKYQNAEFLADFALETEAALRRLYYLGPLRKHPRRIYFWSGDTPESVGQEGEFTIVAILAAAATGRQLSRGPKKKKQPFDAFIAQWLKDIGIIASFSVKALAPGRREYEVLVKTHTSASEVKITDVGFGVSQVLPALVQAELADVFISAIQAKENGKDRNVQFQGGAC